MEFGKYFSIAKNEVKQAIVDNKRLIILMVVIYVISCIACGIFNDQIMGLFGSKLNAMDAQSAPAMDPALDLFIHNELGGIRTYLLSIFFGIAAFVEIIINGLMVGTVCGELISQNFVYGFAMSFALIVPHGIFEIPATILESVAGVLLFLFIWRFFKTIRATKDISTFKLKAKSSWEVNKVYLKQSIVLMIFCCVLLVIAAIIEGHITGHIGDWVQSFFK